MLTYSFVRWSLDDGGQRVFSRPYNFSRSRTGDAFQGVDGVARLPSVIGRRYADRYGLAIINAEHARVNALAVRRLSSWLWGHHSGTNITLRSRAAVARPIEPTQFYLGRRRDGCSP